MEVFFTKTAHQCYLQTESKKNIQTLNCPNNRKEVARFFQNHLQKYPLLEVIQRCPGLFPPSIFTKFPGSFLLWFLQQFILNRLDPLFIKPERKEHHMVYSFAFVLHECVMQLQVLISSIGVLYAWGHFTNLRRISYYVCLSAYFLYMSLEFVEIIVRPVRLGFALCILLSKPWDQQMVVQDKRTQLPNIQMLENEE